MRGKEIVDVHLDEWRTQYATEKLRIQKLQKDLENAEKHLENLGFLIDETSKMQYVIDREVEKVKSE
ncbi:MAG: hypothetical protein M0P69_19495 [Bacteroidales bacterium]|nr:hypothetical protein [Bacteroidales bacterium]